MKTKLIISILFGLSALSFVLSNRTGFKNVEDQTATSPTSIYQDTTFLIGALDDGFDFDFQRLDELGFNVWHKYIGGITGWTINGAPNDSLLTDISVYGPQVQRVLDSIASHDLKSIMQRPKIFWLSYGQRSDYQCEVIPSNDDLWFYSFNVSKEGIYIQDITDNTQYGNGAKVKYCHGDPVDAINRADTIVKRLKANTEQCFSYSFIGPGTDITNWIVKPKIRIDSTVAHSTLNPFVCKIKVIGQDGLTVLKEVNIRAKNFLDENLNYGGKYIEDFNFTGDTSLIIPGLWGGAFLNAARGNHTNDNNNNKIDIQVYWYGNCDMWIDYVRVDNKVADNLFSTDPNNTQHQDYMNWLLWEARDIACHGESPIKFYIELFSFANIPCMAYVSRKLDSLAYLYCEKNITLTALMSPLYMIMIVPWEERFNVMNTDHVLRNYVEKVGLRDILIACYPFYTNKYGPPEPNPYNARFCNIPNTLPNTVGPGVLSNPISPAAYDDWLQDNLDHAPYYFEPGSTSNYPWSDTAFQWEGAFRWTMELGDAISKAKDIPFLYNGQSHVWYNNDAESHREPTNEEMNMLANVPLTYGARGLIYFYYGEAKGTIGVSAFYGRGFVDLNNEPRYSNVYNQNKWEMTKSLVQRMKKWEPYIMSFDNANRKSYILRLERDDLISETFFNDVVSYEHNPQSYLLPSDIPEPVSQRYLQVGKFHNPDELYSKYFMIVNRRCSPTVTSDPGGVNGRRSVTIKLDSASSQFSGFDNWSIYDLEKDSLIKTFDKNVKSTVDLGWYNPGQGKLYKIAP